MCPLSEITSFELDSSRSRKSVIIFWLHNYSSRTMTIKTGWFDFFKKSYVTFASGVPTAAALAIGSTHAARA